MVKKEKKEEEVKIEINKNEEKENLVEDKLEETNEIPNKPSEEEIAEAKKEFEKQRDSFNVNTWSIGNSKERTKFYDYIIHFMTNRIFWTKNGWMGVLKLVEEIEEAYKVANATNEPLKFGYQALEFLYYSLSNPAGIGIESAKIFEAEYEEFLELFKIIEKVLKDVRKDLKEIQFLQEKWGAMSQGFYLEVEDGVEEIVSDSETESDKYAKVNDKDLDI